MVARREWRWLLHDRAALILIFGVPLFAFAVLTAVFSHPVIRDLGVVVVDADRSETSRAFAEEVAASSGLSIVERAGDLASAARAIRSGDAIGAVYVPADFERDLKAGRRPQVVGFYNQQFLTAAGIASSGLGDSLARAAKRAVERAAPKASRIGSLVAETIVLVNPQRNYAQFLLRTLLPMVLHVIVTIAAGYAVGSEFRRRSMRTWLACAGGNPIVALAGKLAPLFGIFFVIMLSVPLILEGLLGISFKGDVPMIVVAGSLLIVGYLALGALMQLLVRDLATGLGLTGLVVSPAFGYAGVGFPTFGMNAFAQAWGAILPVRWYMAVLLGQAARGLPLSESARPFAALAALAVLYSLLALLRLRAIARSVTRSAPAPARQPRRTAPHGIGGAFAAEWRRVLAIRGAFILLVVAPLVYGVFYPQPYLNQILRKIPIAVVDNDLSELSRRIVRRWTQAAPSKWPSAPTRCRKRTRRSTAARSSPWSASRPRPSATCSRAPPSISRSTPMPPICSSSEPRPTASRSRSIRCRRSSPPAARAPTAAWSRRRSHRRARPTFCCSRSSTRSAAMRSYIVPAAFVLILQQLLLIGASLLTVVALAQPAGGAFASVLGRGVAHLTIYLPALALYFIVLPRFYGFSTLGQPLQLFALAALFVLATSFMGQAAGAWFKHPETPTLIFLGTSLPQLFLTGFSWPREAIPESVQPWAISSRRISRSTASFASISWAPACGRWSAIGAGSGASRSSISRSR